MQFVLEYAPLILFFAAYKLHDIYIATGVAIGASIAALIASRLMGRPITKLQWLSLAIIVLFGGATLLLQDETFIKWKPSALYAAMGLVLMGGKLIAGKDWVRLIFGQAEIDAPASTWTRLTWAWVAFLFGMAVLNAYIATHFSLDAWVAFKVWWAMGIFFVFTLGNVFVLYRHMKAAAETSPEEPGNADANGARE